MKRKRFVLLIILLAIIYPRVSKAQMPIVSSSPSTEREIPNTSNLLPVKTETWNDDNIVSLTHYYSTTQNLINYPSSGDILYHYPNQVSASVLGLTTLGTTNVATVTLYGCTITDFCIVNDTIYLCGYNNIIDSNFITYAGVGELFNNFSLLILNLHYINLPAGFYLTNIDYYFADVEKLSLLANRDNHVASFFINYYLFNNVYETFFSPKTRLVDVVHTNNVVGVFGMLNDSIFSLITHDLFITHDYLGKSFVTGALYKFLPEPRFHMTNLKRDSNQVVIGASINTVSSLQFTIADLMSVSMISTQYLHGSELACRSKILSMKFDEEENLYCLFSNGCKNGVDMILYIKPYNATPYATYTITPQNSSIGFNLLKDITLYDDKNKLLALGRTTGFNLYLYDRFIQSTESICDRRTRVKMREAENPTEVHGFQYQSIAVNTATNGITNIIRPATSYIINCQ